MPDRMYPLLFLLLILHFPSPSSCCGGSLSAPVGEFTSPSHPSAYANGLTCEWLINVAPGFKIEFSYLAWELEGTPPTCSYDYVEIRDGLSSSSPLIGKWCGFDCDQPPEVATTSNTAYVKFRTDGSVVKTGFKMRYTALLTPNLYTPPNPCEPQAGGWSTWSSWSSCSVTCSSGTKSRSRSCSNPAPKYGGATCSGSSSESSSCTMSPCPVDGAWALWTSWSSCSLTCGGGTSTRTRTCSNPAPAHGGATCPGSGSEAVSCNTQNCPIDGNWSAWSSYDACTLSCGGGTHSRSRTCTDPAPQFGGDTCVGSPTEVSPCNTQNCPIDGLWSDWSNSSCTVTCGGGTFTRTKLCDSPSPQFGGDLCEGDAGGDGAEVITLACNSNPCPINGVWSAWVDLPCSTTCGNGVRNQTRTCSAPAPQHGGDDCPAVPVGDFQSGVACNLGPCPINGGWSGWTDSGSCSVTCGGGLQLQDRLCDDPAPQHGGLDCPGNGFQNISCNEHSCPPEWNTWQAWGSCSVTCNYGIRQRSRTCNPDGQCAGMGSYQDSEYCTLGSCHSGSSGSSVRLKPYRVSSAAKADFLASSTLVSANPSVSSRIFCSNACLRRRASEHDFASCNGFIIDDSGNCHLGYQSPSWIVEEHSSPGDDASIYFDILLP